MNSPEPVRPGFAAWLWRRPRRWFLLGIPAGGLIAFIVGVIFTGGFVGGLKFAETDAFCTSCHEMLTPYQELQKSVHASNVFGPAGRLRELPRSARIIARPVAARSGL